jgi:hypothetical protein
MKRLLKRERENAGTFQLSSKHSKSTEFSMIERRQETRQVIERFGGASRDRTDGLVVANDALSQLSYSPAPDGFSTSGSF